MGTITQKEEYKKVAQISITSVERLETEMERLLKPAKRGPKPKDG